MKQSYAGLLITIAIALVGLNLFFSTRAAGAQQPSPDVLEALKTKAAIDAVATSNALGAAQQAASDRAAAQAAAARAAQSSARATQTAVELEALLTSAQQTLEAASLAATIQFQETQTAMEV